MYKVISLFTGMGGMDIGFAEDVIVRKESVIKKSIEREAEPPGFVKLKKLPFEIVFQNDILKLARDLLVLNGWNHNFVLGDIKALLKDSNFKLPKADVVIGGFPCQDFSHAGKRQGFDSERGFLYKSFVKVVKRVKPKVFVAENVHGLLTMPNEPIKQIIKDFSDVGYTVKYQLIKAEEIGVPQRRWRVIIMGIRSEYTNLFGDDWNIIYFRKFCPVRPYFQHLQEPNDTTDQAQSVYSQAKRLEKGQGQTEINLDSVGPIMRAEHHGNIEFRPIDDGGSRRLSVREAALLQTFPSNCILTLGKKSMVAYKTIGNAVPPLLAYRIADKVKSILNKIENKIENNIS